MPIYSKGPSAGEQNDEKEEELSLPVVVVGGRPFFRLAAVLPPPLPRGHYCFFVVGDCNDKNFIQCLSSLLLCKLLGNYYRHYLLPGIPSAGFTLPPVQPPTFLLLLPADKSKEEEKSQWGRRGTHLFIHRLNHK